MVVLEENTTVPDARLSPNHSIGGTDTHHRLGEDRLRLVNERQLLCLALAFLVNGALGGGTLFG